MAHRSATPPTPACGGVLDAHGHGQQRGEDVAGDGGAGGGRVTAVRNSARTAPALPRGGHILSDPRHGVRGDLAAVDRPAEDRAKIEVALDLLYGPVYHRTPGPSGPR